MGPDALVVDPHQPKGKTKNEGAEPSLVVGTQGSRTSEALDAGGDSMQEEDGRFVLQRCENQARARAVVQDPRYRVQPSARIGLTCEVQAPDPVPRPGTQATAAQRPACHLDLVAVLADYSADEGLADGHALGGMAPVEDRGNRAAAELRPLGLEAEIS